jgi:large subunit ribosomal protein L24
MHVHREDTVLILTGKDRGKKGRVIRLFPGVERALVEKINMVKRHTRPNQQLPQGGIMEKESPIHISNLQVICGKCNKATRISHKVLGGGQKVRLCKKCGEILDKEK